MPPKGRVTKEEIVDAAVAVVRKLGVEALGARTVAIALACSTQPVFSNFATMDELRLAVVAKAEELCGEYIRREVESGAYPAYKASGMAYIRFAKEEKELFKLLYMRDRRSETPPESDTLGERMTAVVRGNTGLTDEAAKLFHLVMWAFVQGFATMLVTGFVDLDWELISRMLTDAYQGLRKQYEVEG